MLQESGHTTSPSNTSNVQHSPVRVLHKIGPMHISSVTMDIPPRPFYTVRISYINFHDYLPRRPAAGATNDVEKAGANAPTTAWVELAAANKANPPATTGKFTGK